MQQKNTYPSFKNSSAISNNAACVLNALIYFDVFNYPLTIEEILERSTVSNINDVKIAVDELIKIKAIFFIDGFYCLHKNEVLVNKRLAANAQAKKSLQIAKRVTRIIKCFPFLRAVMLSGSISKNYMDKHSDIDYFIITAPNRLWVCRLFFVFFQKVFFFNQYKYFCYNYMIDEEHLAITDRSLYTAIEASTLLPVYNYEMYQEFRNSNLWMQAYFPNYPMVETALLKDRKSFIQYLLEPLFNNRFGEWLDKWLMYKIESKWRKKHLPIMFSGTKNLQLKRHTAKAHTEGHYNRIMDLYNNKKKQFEHIYNIKFDSKTYIIPIN